MTKIETEVAGKVWKIIAAAGTSVEADDTILIVESMKMEIPVAAPRRGTVARVLVAEGDLLREGQAVAELV
jgi:acetyl-CoA carboxylase biotin carboxyl carrier protein